MVKVKATHIPILIELFLIGAKDGYVETSTISLSKKTKKSQQAASRHLLELEETGYIKRIRSGGKNSVKITEEGKAAMTDLYVLLQRVIEGKKPVFEMKGEIFTGLGEGAYYMSMNGYRRQFVKHLGFDPYPGTLNVRLETVVDKQQRRNLDPLPNIHIEGFEDGKRTYGWAKCYLAKINNKLDGAIIILERAHYDHSVIEIISPINIRDRLKLKDGDKISISVQT